MMAPYAVGHLKMSFLLEELGYKLREDDRFQLYLTNTLQMEELEQTELPGMASLSEESHLAGKVKKDKPILVILGNPPYSGISANMNPWIVRLLKDDVDGLQSYYKIDGQPLAEKKVWLQDDYVKFIRFAQWKINQIGGYQVCEKWLKDRKGRVLSLEEIKHYSSIITALKETIELQDKIDRIYPDVEKSLIKF